MPDTEQTTWGTMHVFGYGESQIIGFNNGNDLNFKTANSNLTNVDPFITFLASQKEEGTTLSWDDLHAVDIFYENSAKCSVDYISKVKGATIQHFSIEDSNLSYITAIASELVSLSPSSNI